jgi:hypothetical protein
MGECPEGFNHPFRFTTFQQERTMIEFTESAYAFPCPPDSDWLPSEFDLFFHTENTGDFTRHLEIKPPLERHINRSTLDLDWVNHPRKPK